MHDYWKRTASAALVLLLVLSGPVWAAGAGKRAPQGRIVSLVSEYRGHEGFEVFRVGGLALTALRGLVRFSDYGPDTRTALALMRGVRKVVVVEYGEAAPAARARFDRRLGKMLDDTDLLMEASDDGERVRIFGLAEKDGCTLRDLVIHVPGSSTLVCVFGSLPMDKVAKMVGDGQ